MNSPSPVCPETLHEIAIGTPVSLICCTTDADIYYHGPPEGERKRVTPCPAQLRTIHYTIEGTVEGIEPGQFPYLVLSAIGEKAQFSDKSGHNRLTNSLQRIKVRHVPLLAVVKVVKQ